MRKTAVRLSRFVVYYNIILFVQFTIQVDERTNGRTDIFYNYNLVFFIFYNYNYYLGLLDILNYLVVFVVEENKITIG